MIKAPSGFSILINIAAAAFFSEPKIFGRADCWPTEGRPTGGGAR